MTLFWSMDKVIVLEQRIFADAFNTSSMFKYLYCPCCRVSPTNSMPDSGVWYGFWAQTENFKVHWQPGTIHNMPDEFRLALLLMGIK